MATLIQYDETKSQYQFKVEVEMTLSWTELSMKQGSKYVHVLTKI